MIWKEYRVRGEHATKLKRLCNPSKNAPAVFERYFDMYILAAIVGVSTGSKASPVDPETDSALIPNSVMVTENSVMTYVYRLVLLSDKLSGLSDEELINRAFKYDDDEERVAKNMEVFHSYVLGGIDSIYEEFEDVLNDESDLFRTMLMFANKYATGDQLESSSEF